MLRDHFFRVVSWTLAIEMLLQPVLLALPTNIVHAAEERIAEALADSPETAEVEPSSAPVDEEPRIATVPLPGEVADYSDLPDNVIRMLTEPTPIDDPAYFIEASETEHAAHNPKHHFGVTFTNQGVKIKTEDGGILNMHLSRYGYETDLKPINGASPNSEGARTDFKHGELREWYTNGPNGLKQGFLITAAPEEGSGDLIIEYKLSGNMTATLSSDGTSVVLSRQGSATHLSYGGLTANDIAGEPVIMSVELANQHLRLRIKSAGAAFPIWVDPLVTEFQKISNINGEPWGFLGHDIAINNNTLLIADGANNRVVHVYERNSTDWSLQTTLSPTNLSNLAHFGTALALSGNTIAVSAPDDSGGGGSVFIYERSGSSWTTPPQKVHAQDGTNQNSFGSSIDMDGDTLVIGAPDQSDEVWFRGAVYVFIRNGSSWTQQAKLILPSSNLEGGLGTTVAIDEDVIITRTNGASGHVYMSERDGSIWSPLVQIPLTCPTTQAFDLDNDTLVVGMTAHNCETSEDSAAVYTRGTSGWTLTETLQPVEAPHPDSAFGYSVAIDNDTIIVGAEGYNNNRGAAYVFKRTGGFWTQQTRFVATDGQAYDFFGDTVAVSGGKFLVGAFNKTDEIEHQGAAYIFDDGTGQWTWMGGKSTFNDLGDNGTKGVPLASNLPRSRMNSTSWVTKDDHFWIFGGNISQWDHVTNELWEFDGQNWTWISGSTVGSTGIYGTKGQASPSNMPGPREGAVSWVDTEDNLWLFGGYGYDSQSNRGHLNDLWKFDGQNWTWVSGSDLKSQPGTYGTKGQANPANIPGGRADAISWTDSDGNFWLFGGLGFVSQGLGQLNDLWKFDGQNWTWISGSNLDDQDGIYGTKGQSNSANVPGGRFGAVSWIDSDDNLWLFGGNGRDSQSNSGRLNDLWKFDGQNWTWVSGSNIEDASATYGTKGQASTANEPGSRYNAVAWTDADNNRWLFGGIGYDNNHNEGKLNDLWKFDGQNWTWISGSDLRDQPGVYNTLGMPSPSNVPGARSAPVSWIDSSNNLWLFGGGSPFGTLYLLNDLWRYNLTSQWDTQGSAPIVSGGGNDWPIVYRVPDAQGFAGNPINTSNGNQTFETVDLRLPTSSGEIYFSRNYSSFNAFYNNSISSTNVDGTGYYFPAGTLGAGWRHNYESEVLSCESGSNLLCGSEDDIILITPGGTLLPFSYDAGDYKPAPGVAGKFEYDSGQYVYTSPDGTKLIYGGPTVPSGKLAEINFQLGGTLLLYYNSDDLLSRVYDSDDPERELVFDYDSCAANVLAVGKRLCKVTASDDGVITVNDRAITFGYEVLNASSPERLSATANLSQVTDVRGKIWRYHYANISSAYSEDDFSFNQYLWNFLTARCEGADTLKDCDGIASDTGTAIIRYRYSGALPQQAYTDTIRMPLFKAVEESNGLGETLLDIQYSGTTPPYTSTIHYGPDAHTPGPVVENIYNSDTLSAVTVDGVTTSRTVFDTEALPRSATNSVNIDPTTGVLIFGYSFMFWDATGNLSNIYDPYLNHTHFFYHKNMSAQGINIPEVIVNADGTLTQLIYNTATIANINLNYAACDPIPQPGQTSDCDSPQIPNRTTANPRQTYSFNPRLLLRRVDNALGTDKVTTDFYYDPSTGLLKGIKSDTPGANICYKYNEFRQVTDIYEGCAITYSSTTNDITFTTALPIRHTKIEYESVDPGRVYKVTDPRGRVTKFIYAAGDKSELPAVVIQNYDSNHYYAEEITNADGSVDAFNIATAYFYDASGRVVWSVENYDPCTGDLASLVDTCPAATTGTPNAVQFNFGATVWLRISSGAPQLNRVTHILYDGAGRPYETITNVNPAKQAYEGGYNFSTRTIYDKAGRVAASIENYTSTTLTPDADHPNRPTVGLVNYDLDGETGFETPLALSPDYPDRNRITRYNYNSMGSVSEVIAPAWPATAAQVYTPYITKTTLDPDSGTYLVTYNRITRYEYDLVGNATKVIQNYDSNQALLDEGAVNRFSVGIKADPTDSESEKVYIWIDPDRSDRNQITCISYDALNRPIYTWTSCAPGKADYYDWGGSTYNIVSYQAYDSMGRVYLTVENFQPSGTEVIPGEPPVTILTVGVERNHITRAYYDALGRPEWVVNQFIGDARKKFVDFYYLSPANSEFLSQPDKNLITHYEYNAQGQLIATIGNYREKFDIGGTAVDLTLVQPEIEAGLPLGFNFVTRYYYSSETGFLIQTIDNFVGDIATGAAIAFAEPDRNLMTLYSYSSLSLPPTTVISQRGGASITSTSVFDNLNHVVKDTFDTAGLNQITRYEYRRLGYEVTAIDPSEHKQTTTYDVRGNAKTIVDPDSLALQVTTKYDLFGRPFNSSTGLATESYETVKTVYDPMGLSLKVANQQEVTTYTYDLLGRVQTIEERASSTSVPVVTKYKYDSAGRLVYIFENYTPVWVDGVATEPSCLVPSSSTPDTNVCTHYEYDDVSNLTAVTLGNGSRKTYQYDNQGRLIFELVDPESEKLFTEYCYDAAGNVTRTIRGKGVSVAGLCVSGSGTYQATLYAYNALGQILSINYAGTTTEDVEYHYDAFGKRDTMKERDGSTGTVNSTWHYEFRHDGALDYLCSNWSGAACPGDAVDYGYDTGGFQKSINVTRNSAAVLNVNYAPDTAGRLKCIDGNDPNASDSNRCDDPEDTIYTYRPHDLTSRLTSVRLANGVMTTYGYNARGQLYNIANGSGGNVSSFTYLYDNRGNRTDATETFSGYTASSFGNYPVADSSYQNTGLSAGLPAALTTAGLASFGPSPAINIPQLKPKTPTPTPGTLTPLPTNTPDPTEQATNTPTPTSTDEPTETPTGTTEPTDEALTATPEPTSTQTATPEPTSDPEEPLGCFPQLSHRFGELMRWDEALFTPAADGSDFVITQPTYRTRFTDQGLRFVGLNDDEPISTEILLSLVAAGSSDEEQGQSSEIHENQRWATCGNLGFRPASQGIFEIAAAHEGDVQIGYLLQNYPLHPQSTGDLELVLGILAEDMEIRAGGDAIFIVDENDMGVRIAQAVAIDAEGNQITVQMQPVGDQIKLIVPATWLETATFPVLVDPLIVTWGDPTVSNPKRSAPSIAASTDDNEALVAFEYKPSGGNWDIGVGFADEIVSNPPQILFSNSGDDREPVVVYNSHGPNPSGAAEYIIVFRNGNSIYSRRISAADGSSLGGNTLVATGAQNVGELDLALYEGQDLLSNTGVGLVVWSDRTNSSSPYQVWGMRINESGAPQGPAVQISLTNAPDAQTPKVTFDAKTSEKNFVVVWRQQNDIKARRILQTGSPLTSVFPIINDTDDDATPDVAFSAISEQILVVWRSNQHSHDIDACVLASTSTCGSEFHITTGNEADDLPRVEGDTVEAGVENGNTAIRGGWIVTWQQTNGANNNVRMRVVRSNQGLGSLIDVAVTNTIEIKPVIAVMPNGGAVVAYEDWGTANTTGSIEANVNVGDLSVKGAQTPPYHWHYDYDALGRLKYACIDWDSTTSTCKGGADEFWYAYDAAGNLITFSYWDKTNIFAFAPTTVHFGYNGANQLKCFDAIPYNGICTTEPAAWFYDDFGNLTSDGTTTYAYDSANRLVSVIGSAGTTSYEYNGDGARVAQTQNSVRTEYILDAAAGLTNVLAEIKNPGGSQQVTTYTYGLGLVSQTTGGTTQYFAYDGLGSVRQVLSSAGAVNLTQTFDPFGNPYHQNISAGQQPSYGYTGEQRDANGLTYLRARYYNPAIGRFTQQDPFAGALDEPATLNAYSYVGGNPISNGDPAGTCYGWLSGMRDRLDPVICQNMDMANSVIGNPDATFGQKAFAFGYVAFAGIGVGAGILGTVILAAKAALWCLGSVVCQTLDKIDDVATIVAAARGDPEAANQMYAMTILGVTPDLPLNFAYAKADDVIDALKYGDEAEEAFADMGRLAGAGFADDSIDELVTGLDIPCKGRKNSFSADTPVATEDGEKPISEVEEGDVVLAYNEETGEVGEYTVTDTINHVDEVIIELVIDGETIYTTPEHPFYTDEGEWENAKDVYAGERIRSEDGSYGTVSSTRVIDDANQRMYNLTVDEAHTFFVGEGKWLVHNCGGMPWQLSEEIQHITYSAYPDNYDYLRSLGIEPTGSPTVGIIWDSVDDEFYRASSGSPVSATQQSLRTAVRDSTQVETWGFMTCALQKCLDKIPEAKIRAAREANQLGRFHAFEWDLKSGISISPDGTYNYGNHVRKPSCGNCQQILDHDLFDGLIIPWMGRQPRP
jgi:RHS repeat-associated protein